MSRSGYGGPSTPPLQRLTCQPSRSINPRCAWWWCDEVWRFEIAEEAQAYPDEAIWLTLWRYEIGECADIC